MRNVKNIFKINSLLGFK
jgi:hypothetical protein